MSRSSEVRAVDGTLGIVWMACFIFLPSQKKENEENLVDCGTGSVVKSGEAEVKKYQPCFVDISYHPAFIATHINTSYITESTTTGCILCCK